MKNREIIAFSSAAALLAVLLSTPAAFSQEQRPTVPPGAGLRHSLPAAPAPSQAPPAHAGQPSLAGMSAGEAVAWVESFLRNPPADDAGVTQKLSSLTTLTLNHPAAVIPLLEKRLASLLGGDMAAKSRAGNAGMEDASPLNPTERSVLDGIAVAISYTGTPEAFAAFERLRSISRSFANGGILSTLRAGIHHPNGIRLAYRAVAIDDDALTQQVVEWCEQLAQSAHGRQALLRGIRKSPGDGNTDPILSRLSATSRNQLGVQ